MIYPDDLNDLGDLACDLSDMSGARNVVCAAVGDRGMMCPVISDSLGPSIEGRRDMLRSPDD